VASGADLESLMARYQAGDVTAATALIDCVSPQLLRFFRSQLAARADAEDLLQETWLRIHRVRQTYRPGEPVLAWFYAIARHVGLDHYRNVRRAAARERRWSEMASLAGESGVERDGTDDLEALLQPLSRSQREVIEMLKVAGMSLEEVARATSSSVGSVKQKVHRAYKTLRKRMNDLGPGKKPSGALL
jgi:RNA polymerase sigma-70 factor, ECF subfamily